MPKEAGPFDVSLMADEIAGPDDDGEEMPAGSPEVTAGGEVQRAMGKGPEAFTKALKHFVKLCTGSYTAEDEDEEV